MSRLGSVAAECLCGHRRRAGRVGALIAEVLLLHASIGRVSHQPGGPAGVVGAAAGGVVTRVDDL